MHNTLHFQLQVSSIKKEYDRAQSELNLSRLKMKECDSQISCMVKEQQKLQNKLSDANVERKKLENEVLLSVILSIVCFLLDPWIILHKTNLCIFSTG